MLSDSQAETQSSKSEIISYSLITSNVTLNEPVVIEMTIENTLATPINANLGADRKEGFRFTITRPDGVRSALPPLRREGMSRIGRLTLQPGDSHKQRLLLNEWVDFPTPGKYEITVQLANPIYAQNGLVVAKPHSFHATLEVTPREPEKLKSVCENFLGQMVTSKSYEQAAESVLAISYVNDPIAVPYLEKAMTSGKLVELIAIEGLSRIANKEAIQSLIKALSLQDPVVGMMTRAALTRIESKIADEPLKQQINRALKR